MAGIIPKHSKMCLEILNPKKTLFSVLKEELGVLPPKE